MVPDFSRTLDGREALPALLDDIESGLGERGVSQGCIAAVTIALDEVVSNAFGHGGASVVQVAMQADDDAIAVEVDDDGLAFDPTAAAAPDTGAVLEDRAVGGLGLHLVAKLMDEVAYERRADRNHLRFSRGLRL